MDASSLSLLVGYTHSAALLIVGLLAYALAKPRVARCPYWVRQLFEVVCFGGLFVLAMLAPLEPIAGIRIDLRTTIVCLAVVFGGPLCGFLVGASGIAIRSMLGSSHPELAIVMVALSYLLSVAYTSWLKKNQRKFDYRDLLPLGVGLDLCRVLAWTVVLGPSFTLHAIDAGWLAMLLLVPFSLFGLGSVVLLVEDRRALVQAVADSEARFRSILDQLPEGLTLVDLGDRFTYANKAWEAMTGTTAAASLGRTRQEIWAQTANKSVPFPFVQEVREAARPVRTDPVAIKGRNEVRWVAGTLFPVRDSSGAIREIGTTGADVTELVIAREDLARREAMAQRHKNALLEAVNVTRIVDRPLVESVRALTEIAGEALEVERTALFHVNPSAQTMESVDIWLRSTRRHLPCEIHAMSQIWDVNAGKYYDNVVAIPDAAADPRVADRAEHFHKTDIRALMMAPIFTGGRYFGTMTYSAVGALRQWTAEEIHFARSMADLIALLVSRQELAQREDVAARHKQALLVAVHECRGDRPLLDAIQAVTEIAGEALEVERTTVIRDEFDSGTIVRLDLWERSKRSHAPPQRDAGNAIWRLALGLQREGVIAINDVETEPRLAARAAFLRQNNMRSLLIAQIFAGENHCGILGFASVGAPRHWTNEEMHFARSIADLLALLIARQELAQREAIALRHQSALLEAVNAMRVADRPLIESIQLLTEIAGEALEVERTSFHQADQEAQILARLDLWERSTRRHLPLLQQPLSKVWHVEAQIQRQNVIAIDDVTVEPIVADRVEHFRAHDIRSVMLVPVFVAGHYFGTFGVAAIKEPRRWKAEEVHFARSIADLLAALILADRHRESLAALDLIADGIYVEGENGRIIYANRAALEMAGEERGKSTRGALFGATPKNFPQPPQPLTLDRDHNELSLDRGDVVRDLRIDRSRLPGGGVIVLLHDITSRRAAEREQERLEQQLMQAHRLEAIGQMAGGIAHDFNNLLGAVGGFARFLEEDLKPGSDQHQYARRILNACERGKALVAQILSFAKMRNIERHPLDLHAALEGSRDLLATLARPSTTLSIDIADAPMPILGNEGQVTQLLVNLCANAVDALDGEHGTVSLRARRLTGRAAIGEREGAQVALFGDRRRCLHIFGEFAAARDYVRIDVSDTGKGISEHVLPRIFEPFFTTKHRYGGTGLGLAVVQSVVSFYGGVLYLDSTEGHGTTFTVYLPLTDLLVASPTTIEPAKAAGEGGERVLIIDDDMDVADMLSIGLGRFGYEVATLNDPAEALAAFFEDPSGWDVAVIDRVMPEMDGIALASQLRAIRADLRIILCTGLNDGTFDSADDARAFDLFYTKPVAPEEIAGGIRTLFER